MNSNLKGRVIFSSTLFFLLLNLIVSNASANLALVDTTKIKKLMDESFVLLFTNPEKSEIQIKESLKMSRDIQYTFGEVKSLNILGMIADVQGEYLQAVKRYNEALTIIHNLSEVKQSIKLLQSSTYNGLGLAYYHKSDYEQAIKYFILGLDLAEQTSSDNAKVNFYNNIGLVYHDINDLDKAMHYYQLSFETGKKINNTKAIARGANNIGILLNEKKNYKEAINYHLLSLKLKESDGDTLGISGSYLNLSVVYTNLNQFSKASDYLIQSKKLKLKLNDQLGILEVNEQMIDIFLLQNKFKQAEILAIENLEKVNRLTTIEPKISVYESLYKIHLAQSDYKNALRWYEIKNKLKDSLFTIENNKKITEIENQYEVSKKEVIIKNLEQEKRIQIIWRNIITGGSSILLLVLATIYVLLKQRHTKSKLLLDTQQKLNIQLQTNDQLKSKLFTNISHELRTPLTLIMAPLNDLLLSTSVQNNIREKLKLIYRNSERLLTLVNQTLDMAKLEVGKMKVINKPILLHNLIEEILNSFKEVSTNKSISLKSNIEVPLQLFQCDADKLEKIITNILANAIKFTAPKGQITFSAVFNSEKILKLNLLDTGIGISKEDLPHIFKPFYQSQTMIYDSSIGTGLGLTLVKELVELMQGNIQIESKLGKGTEIQVNIPMIMTEYTKEEDLNTQEEMSLPFVTSTVESNQKQLSESSILIIEDNYDLRKYIGSLFSENFHVHLSENGKDGYFKALEVMPDVIITDVMMPEMNGIELTKKILESQELSHIPIIMLTAKTGQDSVIEGLQSGATDYIEKPFHSTELKIKVENAIKRQKSLSRHYRDKFLFKETSKQVIQSIDDKFIAKVKTSIEKNIDNSIWGVEQLAADLCMSRTQLFRKLKSILDLTPSELIIEIKLQRAASLIKQKADSISQISLMVGFNDQSYFSKCFKKRYGVSPKEYL